MKRVLTLAAVAEMATGLALIVAPSVMGKLLFGVPLAGPAATLAGVRLAMLHLAYVGLSPSTTGPLLRPVVVLHGALAIMLVLTWKRCRSGRA
jgi:hypothetical protein